MMKQILLLSILTGMVPAVEAGESRSLMKSTAQIIQSPVFLGLLSGSTLGYGIYFYRTEQNRTEQNRTEQNRTEQNIAEQKQLLSEVPSGNKITSLERQTFLVSVKENIFDRNSSNAYEQKEAIRESLHTKHNISIDASSQFIDVLTSYIFEVSQKRISPRYAQYIDEYCAFVRPTIDELAGLANAEEWDSIKHDQSKPQGLRNLLSACDGLIESSNNKDLKELRTMKSTLTALNGQVYRLNGQVNGLNGQVNGLNGQVNELNLQRPEILKKGLYSGISIGISACVFAYSAYSMIKRFW